MFTILGGLIDAILLTLLACIIGLWPVILLVVIIYKIFKGSKKK